MIFLRHIVLCFFALQCLQPAIAQDAVPPNENLNKLGINLAKAFKKHDNELLRTCFFNSAEVSNLLQSIAEENGGEGPIQFDADSVYAVLIAELDASFELAWAAGTEEGIKWKKTKFVEVGLSSLTENGPFKMADIILVVRVKDNFFMITFPESFNLNGEWKIGPMVNWVGRVTK